MKRLLTFVVVALILVIAPLAQGAPDRNKPTESPYCPNSSYERVGVTGLSQPADVNGNNFVCEKTVGADGKASEGPQFIDDTAHHVNGVP